MNSSEIISSLQWRYAVKTFDSQKKLSEEQINALESALQLSPSSFGLQLWKFIWIKTPELREKLKASSWNQTQITDASHLLLIATPKEFHISMIDRFIQKTADTRGIPLESLNAYREMIVGSLSHLSQEQFQTYVKAQAYISLGNLLTTAALLKIDACPMEGFSGTDYDRILNLDHDGLKASVVCTLGYRSDKDPYASAKKVRFDKETLFIEK